MSTVLLAAILLGAVVVDLRSRRVPNTLVLAGIAVAFVSHASSIALGRPPLAGPAWWAPLAGMAAGFAMLLPLYLLRATGAGDVKLMAMVGAFIGGVLSMMFMLGGGVAAQTIANVRFMLTDWALRLSTGQGARLAPLQTTAARLPYAVAITLGTGAALLWPLSSIITRAAP